MLSPVSVWISKVFAHNIIRKKRDFLKLVSCFSMEEFILEDLISLFDWHTFIWSIYFAVDLYLFFLWISQLTEDLPENQLHLECINPDTVFLKVLY